MPTPKYLLDAAEVLRAHLDVEDPAFCGSDRMRELLSDRDMRCYLLSWVLPVVDHVAGKQVYYGFRDDMKRSARKSRAQRLEAKLRKAIGE